MKLRILSIFVISAFFVSGTATAQNTPRLHKILKNGVLRVGTTGDWNPMTVRDPSTTWVDPRAEIGRDAVLEPGVVLRGFCHVGAGARIGANCVLDDAAVGAGETVPPLTYLTGE